MRCVNGAKSRPVSKSQPVPTDIMDIKKFFAAVPRHARASDTPARENSEEAINEHDVEGGARDGDNMDGEDAIVAEADGAAAKPRTSLHAYLAISAESTRERQLHPATTAREANAIIPKIMVLKVSLATFRFGYWGGYLLHVC